MKPEFKELYEMQPPFTDEEFRRILVEIVICLKSIKLGNNRYFIGETYKKGDIAINLFDTSEFTFPQLMEKYFQDISVYRNKRIDEILDL